MPERKTPRRSPAKPRTLNRWDDDLDKGLMLSIQYACSEAGLKIPWARVAEIMGPTFTDGGIVQHLAKLRNLMIAAGMPVPPSVKRGMVTKSPSKIYGSSANPRIKLEPIEALFPNGTSSTKIKQEEDDEPLPSIYERGKHASSKLKEMANDDTEMLDTSRADAADEEQTKLPVKSRAKAKAKSRNRRRGNMSDEDDEESIPELYDSESEYSVPKKRRRTAAKSRRRTPASKGPATATRTESESEAATLPIPVQEEQDDNVAIKIEEDDTGPASRTRGVKRDYSQMAAPSSEEIDIEDEDQQEEVHDDVNESVQNQVEEGNTEAVVQNESECQEAELEVEAADSEAEADVETEAKTDTDVAHTDTAMTQAKVQVQTKFPAQSETVNTAYGQLKVDTDLAAIMNQQYQPLTTGYGNSFSRVDYLNGGNTFSGNQFGFSNNAMMNFMPRGNVYNGHLSSMSIYSLTPDSSANNSMNNGLGLSNLPAMSDDTFLNSFNFGNDGSGGMDNEPDPANSMRDGDIFFTQDGDYRVDA